MTAWMTTPTRAATTTPTTRRGYGATTKLNLPRSSVRYVLNLLFNRACCARYDGSDYLSLVQVCAAAAWWVVVSSLGVVLHALLTAKRPKFHARREEGGQGGGQALGYYRGSGHDEESTSRGGGGPSSGGGDGRSSVSGSAAGGGVGQGGNVGGGTICDGRDNDDADDDGFSVHTTDEPAGFSVTTDGSSTVGSAAFVPTSVATSVDEVPETTSSRAPYRRGRHAPLLPPPCCCFSVAYLLRADDEGVTSRGVGVLEERDGEFEGDSASSVATDYSDGYSLTTDGDSIASRSSLASLSSLNMDDDEGTAGASSSGPSSSSNPHRQQQQLQHHRRQQQQHQQQRDRQLEEFRDRQRLCTACLKWYCCRMLFPWMVATDARRVERTRSRRKARDGLFLTALALGVGFATEKTIGLVSSLLLNGARVLLVPQNEVLAQF